MNARLNLDRFKAARLPRAKGFAETSTLLRELLERTRAASTLSDLPRPWRRTSSGASRFAQRPASTDGADLSAPPLSGMPDALRDFLDRVGEIGSASTFKGTVLPTRAPAPVVGNNEKR